LNFKDKFGQLSFYFYVFGIMSILFHPNLMADENAGRFINEDATLFSGTLKNKKNLKKYGKSLYSVNYKDVLWASVNFSKKNSKKERILVIENSKFKSIKVFVNEDEPILEEKTKNWSVEHRYPTFLIPKGIKKLLLKIENGQSFGLLKLPLKTYSLNGFYHQKLADENFNFFILGIVFLIFFYNVFNYYSKKSKNTIVFCFYTVILSLVLITFNSFLRGPFITHMGFRFMWSLGLLSFTFLGKYFLMPKGENQRKFLKIILFTGYFVFIFIPALPNFLSEPVICFYTVFTLCGMTYLSIYSLKKGDKTAKYFLLGTLLFFFSLITQILSDIGFFPEVFKSSLVVGSALKLLVISFGLEEINIIENDEISVKAEDLNDANHKLKLLYRKIEKANSRLENKVKARTNELFSSLNETKDILNNMRQAVFSADENFLIIYPVSKYSEEIFGENIVGKNVCEEIFNKEFLEKLGFVLSISMNMDLFQFESMEDTIPKKTSIDLKDGRKKQIKVQLSPICDEEDLVKRVMFIIEDITEEEKLKEEVRRTQEKAEYRIKILQEIVSNSRSEFRVFIKEVFETLEEWGDDEGAKRSLHTIKGSSRFFNLESLSNKVHALETEYQSSNIEEIKEKLTNYLEEYKNAAQEVFGEEFLSETGEGAEEFIEVPKNKFEVALHSAKEMTSAKAVLRIFSKLMMSEIKGELEKLKPTVFREARKLEKNITFKVSGNEALFERKTAKIIRESVIHLINNSISHGIEKSGLIEITVTRKKPDIILGLKDDGRGINSEDIYNKAIDKGLLDGTKDFLNEEEKLQLIFKPGFSTAEKVSEMSGRGVGMDVVKKNIEGLGGDIIIRTELGKGTEFLLKIPSL